MILKVGSTAQHKIRSRNCDLDNFWFPVFFNVNPVTGTIDKKTLKRRKKGCMSWSRSLLFYIDVLF